MRGTPEYQHGYNDGESTGYSRGHSSGYDTGYSSGYFKGHKEGRDSGYNTAKIDLQNGNLSFEGNYYVQKGIWERVHCVSSHKINELIETIREAEALALENIQKEPKLFRFLKFDPTYLNLSYKDFDIPSMKIAFKKNTEKFRGRLSLSILSAIALSIGFALDSFGTILISLVIISLSSMGATLSFRDAKHIYMTFQSLASQVSQEECI